MVAAREFAIASSPRIHAIPLLITRLAGETIVGDFRSDELNE
jgi:hypothetical protein